SRTRSAAKAPAAVPKRRTIAVVINAKRIALFMGVRLREQFWQAAHQVYKVDCAGHFSSRIKTFRQSGGIEGKRPSIARHPVMSFFFGICIRNVVVPFGADRVLKVQSVCRIHARLSNDKKQQQFLRVEDGRMKCTSLLIQDHNVIRRALEVLQAMAARKENAEAVEAE